MPGSALRTPAAISRLYLVRTTFFAPASFTACTDGAGAPDRFRFSMKSYQKIRIGLAMKIDE
jgi:hypothetical protein